MSGAGAAPAGRLNLTLTWHGSKPANLPRTVKYCGRISASAASPFLLWPAVLWCDLGVSCDAGQQTQDDKCEKKFDAVRASLDAFGIGHGLNANNRRGLDLNLKEVTEHFVAKINS
jgi:hypothetical protein